MSRRALVGTVVLLAAALAACGLRLMIDRPPGGSVGLAWPEPSYAAFRLTATVAGALVGAGLAVSGVMLQVLLRNPLASPFLLGLSSGAGLGIMIALAVAAVAGGTLHGAGYTGPAAAGALATLLVVYTLGQRGGWLDPVTLILVGVIVSTMCGAGIMFLHHLVPLSIRGEFTTWLMGHVPETATAGTLIVAAVIVLGGTGVAIALGRAMDVATLSDDEAESVGLSIGRLRLVLFVLSGIVTAATVALAGPIGFVGLVAPHAARLVLGPRHRPLVIGAALAGVALVVGADVLRQAIDVGRGRLPIGVFTAIVGGVVVIWLLRSGKGRV